jgi:transposase
MRTIELGVTITDAAVDEKQTTIFCTPVARDPRCPDCGRQGRYRDTVTRPLTDLPVAGYPLVLRVAVPRYRCESVACGRAVFNQDLATLASPHSSTTRRCARYVLRRLMIDRTTISAIAAELGVLAHGELDRDARHRRADRRGGVNRHWYERLARAVIEALKLPEGREKLPTTTICGRDRGSKT